MLKILKLYIFFQAKLFVALDLNMLALLSELISKSKQCVT